MLGKGANYDAFRVASTLAVVRQGSILPFDVSLELLDNPLSEDYGWLHLLVSRLEQVRGDAGRVLWLQEEGRRESLNADVQHAVLRRLHLKVGYP